MYIYVRITPLFLGTLDFAPDKMSFDPFPNQTRLREPVTADYR